MTFKKFSELTLIALTISLGVALYGGNQSVSARRLCRPRLCYPFQMSIDTVSNNQKFNGSFSVDGQFSGRGTRWVDTLTIVFQDENSPANYTYSSDSFVNDPPASWTKLISGLTGLPDGKYTITAIAEDTDPLATDYPTESVYGVIYDTTAPVITISGSNPTSFALNSSYLDAGATAVDGLDGDITGSMTVTSNVNINVAGTYSVVYSVADSAGNSSTATRNVTVVSPVVSTSNITLASANTTTETEQNALGAEDNKDSRVFEDQSFAVAGIDQSNNSAKKTWLWLGAIIAAAITGAVIYFKNKQTQTTGKKK